MYTFAKFSLALVTFHGLMGNNISAIPHRLNKANKSYFYPGQMEFFAPCCLQPRAAIKSTRTTIVLYLRFIRTRFKLYHYYPTYFSSNKFPSLSNIPLLPPPPPPRYHRSNFPPRSTKTLDRSTLSSSRSRRDAISSRQTVFPEPIVSRNPSL